MRTLNIQAGPYTATMNTNDKVCEAFGKCFLNIKFDNFATIPEKIKVLCGSYEFEKAVNTADVANIYAFFDLTWFKYFAPKFGTKEIKIEVEFDGYWVTEINYLLTAGRGEVDVTPKTISTGSNEYFNDDIAIICPTQATEHWRTCEILIKKAPNEVIIEGVEGDMYWVSDIAMSNIGIRSVDTDKTRNMYVHILNEEERTETYTIAEYNVQSPACYNIELRITNRHGLRGVVGGKIIDTSEGGDDVKSNVDTFTPYNGIFRHEKIGQKIQKEVYFDCEGDADLLGLLRDACVYGVVEWYDERTEQWLPCQVVENSLDTDPFKEQSITFILQQL